MKLFAGVRRRRAWVIAATAAVVLYALFGFLGVPWIARSQIRQQARALLNREAEVERVRCNPFRLVVTIDGFRLADRDGIGLLAFDRLRVNLQVSGLFRRAWRFREVVLVNPVVSARVLADGRLSVADLMEPNPAAEKGEPFRRPRLIVDRLAVIGGRIEFADHSRAPEFNWRFEPLNLEVRDLITLPDHTGEHSITVGVGENAEVRWAGRQSVEPLRFTGRFDITGISLSRVWEYFGHRQPIEVSEGRLDVVLPYDLHQAADGSPALTVEGASFEVHDLVARPSGGTENWLSLPRVSVQGVVGAWPERKVRVASVRIENPRAVVRVQDDGTLNWTALLEPDPEAALATGPAAMTPAAAPGPPVDARIALVEIEGGSARFEDLTTEPDVGLDLSDLSLRLEEVSSDLTTPVTFRTQARVQDAGAVEASGSVIPDPLAGELEFDLSGLDLPPLYAYAAVPTARLGAGKLAAKGSARLTGAPLHVLLKGAGTIDALQIVDARGGELLTWNRMTVTGLSLEHPPSRARIQTVGIDRPFAKVHIDREGQLNLLTLMATPPTAPAPAAPTTTALPATVPAVAEPAGAAGLPLRFEIGTVRMANATIDYTDESLLLPFGTNIHSANGSMRDLSSFGAAAATLELEGRVAETGYLKAGGEIRLSDPLAAAEVELDFRALEMPTLTPYAATFAGYAIESGALDLDVHYLIRDRRLVGEHRAVASNLVLGDQVEGAEGVGLPVRLAVALLKDKDGRIDLEVPIEGAVDSPEFTYRKVVWQAIRTILGNIAKAPFRALGRLFGRDEDDLELVEFDPGRSDLLPAEQEKLRQLAEQIGPRRELALEVEGRFDPVSDPEALRRTKLEALIESRRAASTAVAAESGASTLEMILEALFVEQSSAEALEAERLKFTSAAAAPFDAAGFYAALRQRLLEAQTVSAEELATLATARAGSILAALTASGAVPGSRVQATAPAEVKRRKAGSERVASEMLMSAERNKP